MCCHWHPWGNTFATAFQCGQLLVWDVRTKQVLLPLTLLFHVYEPYTCSSSRQGHFSEVVVLQRVAQLRTQGRAIRSVKYSSEPNDLLAFGEHEQSFHLVDARNYSARQTLQVSVSSIGISGMAFDATVRCPYLCPVHASALSLHVPIDCFQLSLTHCALDDTRMMHWNTITLQHCTLDQS